MKKRKQALALEIEARGAVAEVNMIGVLGREDSDLGLEIIELLSGGYSGVDGLNTIIASGTRRLSSSRGFSWLLDWRKRRSASSEVVEDGSTIKHPLVSSSSALSCKWQSA